VSFIAPDLPRDVLSEGNIRLGKIEAKHDVLIVCAVESGSRAWGFPSPDSDNDVRFFYVRPLSKYVGLDDPRDVIEEPIDGLWDVNGWDLRKALRLLVGDNNATVAEWLSSPLIYREHGPVPYKLRDLIKRHASSAGSAKHYYGLTSTCYKKDIDRRPKQVEIDEALDTGRKIKGFTEVNQKKYLYALRGSLAIQWIKRYEEVPPMALPALMSHDIIPPKVREEIGDLLRRKATMGEYMNGPRIAVLDEFIEGSIAWVKDNGMDKTPVNKAFKAEANQLLLDALGLG